MTLTKESQISILIMPSDSYAGLEICRSLHPVRNTRLFGAVSGEQAQVAGICTKTIELSLIYSEGGLARLNSFISENHIQFVFPASRDAVNFLSVERERLSCTAIVPSEELLRLVDMPDRLFRTFEGILPVSRQQAVARAKTPHEKRGSLDTDDAEKGLNINRITSASKTTTYTVTCFSDNQGNLLYSQTYIVEEGNHGELLTAKATSVEIQQIVSMYSNTIQEKLRPVGAWSYRLIDKEGEFMLRSFDSAISEVMACDRLRGVNMPILTIYQLMGKKITVMPNQHPIEMVTQNKSQYKSNITFNCVYIDLDDTILIKGRLNVDVIRFLYKCFNEGKKLVLISKAIEKDKVSLLKKWRLDSIFDEVIWLDMVESKADHIKDSNSIFIDDSFAQREEVARRLNIQTFDPSMLEILLHDS